jgi:hypothetical protein
MDREKDLVKSSVQFQFSAFVQAILHDYHTYGTIVGEDANLASLFFVAISKEFPARFRLHAVVQNLSGAGKSTILDAILAPFKLVCADDVIEVQRFTAAALERFGNFDGKILYHSQTFGSEPQTILPLLSEGKLGLLVTERESNSSKFQTKFIQCDGLPVFFSTAVDTLDPQFTRRVILRTLDESQTQTRAILEKQAQQFYSINPPTLNPFPFASKVISRVRDARPTIIDHVVIPFSHALESKLPDNLEMRSNFPKFLKLIASIAIVKSLCYRGFYEVEIRPEPPLKTVKSKVVIAEPEDFIDAYLMAGKGFFQPLTAAEEIVLRYLSQKVEPNLTNSAEQYSKIRLNDFVRALNLSRTHLFRILESLADKGLVLKEALAR